MNKLNWRQEEIESWIDEASRNQNIPVQKLPEQNAKLVMEAARRRYVSGNPRVWWLDLKKPIEEQYDSRSIDLTSIMPDKSGTCWFIPETEAWTVYEVDITQIQRLLNDCPLFEYNLLARDFSWLVIETDHNMFYVCRDPSTAPTTS